MAYCIPRDGTGDIQNSLPACVRQDIFFVRTPPLIRWGSILEVKQVAGRWCTVRNGLRKSWTESEGAERPWQLPSARSARSIGPRCGGGVVELDVDLARAQLPRYWSPIPTVHVLTSESIVKINSGPGGSPGGV